MSLYETVKQQTYRIRRVWVQVQLAVLPNVAGLEIKLLKLLDDSSSHTLHIFTFLFFFFFLVFSSIG